MSRNRRSAYGGPHEGKEVVISIDRRLAYVVVLVAAFALAVGGGYLLSHRGTRATAGAVAMPTQAPSGPNIAIDEAAARQTAGALGLNPDSVTIVTPNVAQPVVPTVGTGVAPGEVRVLTEEERARVTPVDDLQGELLNQGDGTVLEVNPDPLRYKDHEVLSNTVDPNVDVTEHRPLRLETVTKPVDGPRLAVSDLNINYTYDFGPVPMSERRSHTFVMKNVGTEDLVISRIYTGCGCTATTVGDQPIPPDGILPAPLTLAPGEEIAFAVEYDAAAEGRPGATSKYIQIFSNDPTYARFDDGDPLTHETRFRIVVEPQY